MQYEQLVNTYVAMFKHAYAISNDKHRYSVYGKMQTLFGLKPLGTGNSSVAFRSKDHPDIVVKISNNDEDGGVAYMTYCYVQQLQGKRSSWMPEIYCMYVDPISTLTIVLMEYIPSDVSGDDMYEWCKLRGVGCRNYVSPDTHNYALLPPDFISMYEELGQVSDLHADNIRQRYDGSFVLTDPYHDVRNGSLNIWFPYQAGQERFIGKDYLAEIEALMGESGKPSIEPERKGELSGVPRFEVRQSFEPWPDLMPEVLPVWRNRDFKIGHPIGRFVKAKSGMAAAFNCGNTECLICRQDNDVDGPVRGRGAVLIDEINWNALEQPIRNEVVPEVRRDRASAKRDKRQNNWAAIQGHKAGWWARKQVPPDNFGC